MASNPFMVLSYVGGPALLTNACSLLLLSTSNRFARAVDRSRLLADHVAHGQASQLGIHELADVGKRVALIAWAMSCFYFAAAMFGLATVISIAGAVLAAEETLGFLLSVAAAVCGSLGFAAFVTGAVSLVIEMRIAVRALAREADEAVAMVARHAAGTD